MNGKKQNLKNKTEIIEKLINDCMNYKAEKLKKDLKEENKIILFKV